MPPASRKRRMVVEEEDDNGSEQEVTQSTQHGRRRAPPSDESEEEDETQDAKEDVDIGDGENSQDQVVKKLVRYALACEYSRLPITRAGIREKVLSKQRGTFKRIFESTQKQLRTKFGMEMVELPAKEKITLRERRAATQKTNVVKPSPNYILATILPPGYRVPAIIPPSIVENTSTEAAYIGLYTMVISLIALNGGTLSESKLDRYLNRMNANQNMPMDKTEAVLQRMLKQGYLIKVKERQGDEETTDYLVGPRGKVEVGNNGIKGLVAEVYGDSAPDDLHNRIHSSLGMEITSVREMASAAPEQEEEPSNQPSTWTTTAGRKRRVAVDDDDE